jgi:hypothetical protein
MSLCFHNLDIFCGLHDALEFTLIRPLLQMIANYICPEHHDGIAVDALKWEHYDTQYTFDVICGHCKIARFQGEQMEFFQCENDWITFYGEKQVAEFRVNAHAEPVELPCGCCYDEEPLKNTLTLERDHRQAPMPIGSREDFEAIVKCLERNGML